MSARGTSNTNDRGGSPARRARKAFLLSKFGDGYTAPCAWCEFELDWFTITVDRIIAGVLGGSYRRDNIQPACMTCNSVEGSKLRDRLKLERLTLV